MTVPTEPTTVADRIRSLLEERQRLLESLARIDGTLARIAEVLGTATPTAPAVASASAATTVRPSVGAPPAAPARRRGAGKYKLTAEQMIVEFVGSRKEGATTHDIRAHWTAQGRPGVPDYVISRLVKDGILNRQRLGGKSGSRFTLGPKAKTIASSVAAANAAPAAKPVAAKAPSLPAGQKRLTGPQFILEFVRQHKNPTTAEIVQAWKSAKRGGRADKVLSKMVARGDLKREPYREGRGSRYVLP